MICLLLWSWGKYEPFIEIRKNQPQFVFLIYLMEKSSWSMFNLCCPNNNMRFWCFKNIIHAQKQASNNFIYYCTSKGFCFSKYGPWMKYYIGFSTSILFPYVSNEYGGIIYLWCLNNICISDDLILWCICGYECIPRIIIVAQQRISLRDELRTDIIGYVNGR